MQCAGSGGGGLLLVLVNVLTAHVLQLPSGVATAIRVLSSRRQTGEPPETQSIEEICIIQGLDYWKNTNFSQKKTKIRLLFEAIADLWQTNKADF